MAIGGSCWGWEFVSAPWKAGVRIVSRVNDVSVAAGVDDDKVSMIAMAFEVP